MADGNAGGKAGPMQKRYFKDGLTAVTLVPIAQQVGVMRVLAGSLAKADDTAIAGHASGIEMAANALEDGIDAHQIAIQGAQVAYGQLVEGRQAWIRVYEKTYGELVVRMGKRSAESFFKVPKKLP